MEIVYILKYILNSEFCENFIILFTGANFGWKLSDLESPKPFICEISLAQVHMIINIQRGYGTQNIMTLNYKG